MSHQLTSIPGVGLRIAQVLNDLGFHQVSDLRSADPEQMFSDLCELRGTKIDRCVLYVFRCGVYFASHSEHDPEALKWWNWKD